MSTESNKQDCSICLEPALEDTTVTECGHKFHKACLRMVRKPTCPYCRAPLKCDGLTSQDMAKIMVRSNGVPYYENEVGEDEVFIEEILHEGELDDYNNFLLGFLGTHFVVNSRRESSIIINMLEERIESNDLMNVVNEMTTYFEQQGSHIVFGAFIESNYCIG